VLSTSLLLSVALNFDPGMDPGTQGSRDVDREMNALGVADREQLDRPWRARAASARETSEHRVDMAVSASAAGAAARAAA
jgi:hypothetical protein